MNKSHETSKSWKEKKEEEESEEEEEEEFKQKKLVLLGFYKVLTTILQWQ